MCFLQWKILISSVVLSTVKILNVLLCYEPVFIKQCLLRIYLCTLYKDTFFLRATINLLEMAIVHISPSTAVSANNQIEIYSSLPPPSLLAF